MAPPNFWGYSGLAENATRRKSCAPTLGDIVCPAQAEGEMKISLAVLRLALAGRACHSPLGA